jgi:hypothetical protein
MVYCGPADAKSTNVPSAAGFSIAPVVKASAANNSGMYRMVKMIPKKRRRLYMFGVLV